MPWEPSVTQAMMACCRSLIRWRDRHTRWPQLHSTAIARGTTPHAWPGNPWLTLRGRSASRGSCGAVSVGENTRAVTLLRVFYGQEDTAVLDTDFKRIALGRDSDFKIKVGTESLPRWSKGRAQSTFGRDPRKGVRRKPGAAFPGGPDIPLDRGPGLTRKRPGPTRHLLWYYQDIGEGCAKDPRAIPRRTATSHGDMRTSAPKTGRTWGGREGQTV